MEWIYTLGPTVEEAKEAALEELGVDGSEAELEVIEEPKTNIFGRLKSEARVRARVKPQESTPPRRPRNDRTRRKGSSSNSGNGGSRQGQGRQGSNSGAGGGDSAKGERTSGDGRRSEQASAGANNSSRSNGPGSGNGSERQGSSDGRRSDSRDNRRERTPRDQPEVELDAPAVSAHVEALVMAMISPLVASPSVGVEVEGSRVDILVEGEPTGLLIGHGGRTMRALEDIVKLNLTRSFEGVGRVRLDVAQLKEQRDVWIDEYVAEVVATAKADGNDVTLEPMSAPDRKRVHDTVANHEGVGTRSIGERDSRRVVITVE